MHLLSNTVLIMGVLAAGHPLFLPLQHCHPGNLTSPFPKSTEGLLGLIKNQQPAQEIKRDLLRVRLTGCVQLLSPSMAPLLLAPKVILTTDLDGSMPAPYPQRSFFLSSIKYVSPKDSQVMSYTRTSHFLSLNMPQML